MAPTDRPSTPLVEWLRENAPDCGDNSCLFGGRGKGGMRTNGGCRCFKDLPTAKRIYVERLYAALSEKQSHGWIDLNDQLPPDAPIEVITVSCDGELVSTRSARWVRALHADAKRNGELCAISHWQHLPEAP